MFHWSDRLRIRVIVGSPPAPGSPVAVFCGIARPGPLIRAVEALGHPVEEEVSFADHHPFSEAELRSIYDRAAKQGIATIMTTGKDEVRLPLVDPPRGISLCVVDLEIEWREAAAEVQIRERLRALHGRPQGRP